MEKEVPGEACNGRDDLSRDAMIERWMPLVRFAVRRMATGGNMRLYDIDDLVSYGTIGLIQAVDRFDPERGVSFQGYALARIRGAILDALRAADIVPRGLRSTASCIERTADSLAPELGRLPTRAEVQRETGLTDREYERAAAALQTKVVSLERLAEADPESEQSRAEPLQLASPDEPVVVAMVRRELYDALASAVAALPERDRLVLSLYYAEGLSLKEIGAVLGVSESRIAQLRMRAIDRLRISSPLRAVA
jgi:RNA polymerase sigma factor for flagellar operon FliA